MVQPDPPDLGEGQQVGEARFVEQPLEQNAHGVFGSADVAAEGGRGGHGCLLGITSHEIGLRRSPQAWTT